MPGTSVCTEPPVRRAIRCVTRRLYSSSSFVPSATWSATVTEAETSAVRSAQPKLSTLIDSPRTREANCSISASSERIRTKPAASISGSRSAAISGGSTAFRTPISAATSTAPRKSSIETCGMIAAATNSATEFTSQATIRRSGWIFGRAGCQTGAS